MIPVLMFLAFIRLSTTKEDSLDSTIILKSASIAETLSAIFFHFFSHGIKYHVEAVLGLSSTSHRGTHTQGTRCGWKRHLPTSLLLLLCAVCLSAPHVACMRGILLFAPYYRIFLPNQVGPKRTHADLSDLKAYIHTYPPVDSSARRVRSSQSQSRCLLLTFRIQS